MSRIITISSGLAGVGKTHIAVNLALEMVRRGRQVALFNQTSSQSSIDDVLVLPQAAIRQRRSTDHGDSLVRRGYQGVDIISSGVPLSQWGSAPELVVREMINDMDIPAGYDDFLVDTSAMNPRTQLACCRASSLLVLVITPDFRSLAEVFALLRILQLNEFDSEVFFLVNRVEQLVDADELYGTLKRNLGEHLGLDVPLLGVLVNDAHVRSAERSREAFSSLFPDAELSGQIVAMADAMNATMAVQQDVSAYWRSFREISTLPVALTGGAFLEMLEDTDEVAVLQPPPGQESGKEAILLQLDADSRTFSDTLGRLPGLLHATADEVSDLYCLLEEGDDPDRQKSLRQLQDSSSFLRFAVLLIREIERLAVPVHKLQLQVQESRIRGDLADWLQAGCYLKYIFRFPDQDDILFQVKSMLAETTVFRRESGEDGETVWEKLATDRNGCVNIIHAPEVSIRIQVWLPLRKPPQTHQDDQKPVTAAVLAPSRMIH